MKEASRSMRGSIDLGPGSLHALSTIRLAAVGGETITLKTLSATELARR